MEGSGQIEALNMEELLKLRALGSNICTNACDPWLPLGAQGIYGGTMVAHCIMAARATVRGDCSIASLRSTFVQGGAPRTPIHYKVDELEADASLPLRAVRASQKGQCIFTAVVRFQIRPHQDARDSLAMHQATSRKVMGPVKDGGGAAECPYICSDLEVSSDPQNSPQDITISQWVKVRRPLMLDDPMAQLAAIAYMSDNYLLPMATRVHGIHWVRDPEVLPSSLKPSQLQPIDEGVNLMVSLDHTILFHPVAEAVRADAWIRPEMQSPWAGHERALVSQRMFAATGHLIATVYQEVNRYHSTTGATG